MFYYNEIRTIVREYLWGVISMKKTSEIRIINLTKFIIFVICTLLVLLIASYLLFLTAYTARGEAVNQYSVVTVMKGDSLWSIASHRIAKDENTRDYVEELIKVNDLGSSAIYEGDQLKIPLN